MKLLARIAKAGSSIVGTVVTQRLLILAGFAVLFFVSIPRVFQQDGSPIGPDAANADAPSCDSHACSESGGGCEGCGSCGACACSCDGGAGDCCGGSEGSCGGGDGDK